MSFPSLVFTVAAIAGGLGLAAASIWFRTGLSKAARWWVRTTPVSEMTHYAFGESVALVLSPLVAQTLIVVGSAAILWDIAGATHPAVNPLLGTLFCSEVVVWTVLLLQSAYQWVLPTWVYPRWLRATRRAERADLKAGRVR